MLKKRLNPEEAAARLEVEVIDILDAVASGALSAKAFFNGSYVPVKAENVRMLLQQRGSEQVSMVDDRTRWQVHPIVYFDTMTVNWRDFRFDEADVNKLFPASGEKTSKSKRTPAGFKAMNQVLVAAAKYLKETDSRQLAEMVSVIGRKKSWNCRKLSAALDQNRSVYLKGCRLKEETIRKVLMDQAGKFPRP